MIELLTALLLVVTGWYAWTTHRILGANKAAVQAMREQSEALTRPYIIVETFNEGALYYLRVRNGGSTVAHNLRLTMDRSFHQWGRGGRDITESRLFSEGTASFAPGASIVYGLGEGSKLFHNHPDRDVMPLQFSVTARYNFGGRVVEETTTIDLEQYRGMVLHAQPVERELTQIRKALESRHDVAQTFCQDVREYLQAASTSASRSQVETGGRKTGDSQ